MKLQPFLSAHLVWEIDGPIDRDALFGAIAAKVIESSSLAVSHSEFVKALIAREELSPSLMASGIAFPHAILKENMGTQLAVVHIKGGATFPCSGMAQADVVFAVVGNTTNEWEQLKIIARAFRLCRIPKFLEKLRNSSSAANLLSLVIEEDTNHV